MRIWCRIATAVALVALTAPAASCRLGPDAATDGSNATDAATADATSDGSAPTLTVVNSGSEVIVDATDRFTLHFVESSDNQPMRWHDSSRPGVDLSGLGTGLESGSIMTPMIVCGVPDCVGVADMNDMTFTVEDESPDSVVLLVTWDWVLGSDTMDGSARYTIGGDGVWTADLRLTNTGTDPLTGTVEVAESSVNDTLPWEFIDAPDGLSFSYRLPPANGDPEIRFDASLISGITPTIASDAPNNRYFNADFDLDAGSDLAITWSVTLWRPN